MLANLRGTSSLIHKLGDVRDLKYDVKLLYLIVWNGKLRYAGIIDLITNYCPFKMILCNGTSIHIQ